MVLAPFVAAALFPYLTIMDFLHLLRCGSLGGTLDGNGCLEHAAPYYNFRSRIKSLLRGVCAVGLATPAADVLLRGVVTPILHARADCMPDFVLFTQRRWNVDLQPAEGLEAVAQLRGFPNLITFLRSLNVHAEVADFMLELPHVLGDGYLLRDALPFDGSRPLLVPPVSLTHVRPGGHGRATAATYCFLKISFPQIDFVLTFAHVEDDVEVISISS